MTATLNRFISWSVDRYRYFFQLLNKWKGFEWTEECALAFQQLKEYLSRPPIMSRHEVDEVLFAYIVVAFHAVSLVLIRVDSGVQRPVYYISKSLHESRSGTYHLRRPFWQWCMARISSPIISNHTRLLSWLNSRSDLYFKVPTTQGELQNGARS